MSNENGWEIGVTETGPASCTVTMTATAALVDSHVNNAIDEVRRDFALPGFRKGKAPRQLIERRIGDRLYDDIRQKLVGEGWQKAVEDHELNPVGEPRLPEGETQEPPTPSKGNPFTITLEVEVAPKFDLPELSSIELKRPVIEVDESMIEEEITRLSTRHGETESMKENFKPLDRIIGHAKAQVEDEEERVDVELGEDVGIVEDLVRRRREAGRRVQPGRPDLEVAAARGRPDLRRVRKLLMLPAKYGDASVWG